MVENYQEMLSSEHSGFIRHNGIRVVSVDEEKSVLTADVTPENSNIWGGVHGGFLYAMADTAAGAFARINYSQHNVTLNGSINYLRSTVQSKALTAVGRPVRVGGHIGFFEVNITDDTGALIAQLRKEQGLTQKQLAEQLHISDRTISKWERGVSHS